MRVNCLSLQSWVATWSTICLEWRCWTTPTIRRWTCPVTARGWRRESLVPQSLWNNISYNVKVDKKGDTILDPAFPVRSCAGVRSVSFRARCWFCVVVWRRERDLQLFLRNLWNTKLCLWWRERRVSTGEVKRTKPHKTLAFFPHTKGQFFQHTEETFFSLKAPFELSFFYVLYLPAWRFSWRRATRTW